MAKRGAHTRKPKGRPVTFNLEPDAPRTAAIALPGFAPFEITFRVPSAVWLAGLAMARTEAGESADLDRAEAMVKLIVAHLDDWTLDVPADEAHVRAIQEVEVLFAIFKAIHEAGVQAKN